MAVQKIVNTRFGATGNILKRFGAMTRASARFGRNVVKSFRMANRQASRFNKITSGFLKAQVIGKGVGLLTQGLGSVTTQFIAFDKAALGATVRFKDIGPEAANFNEQLKLIRASAREAGATTEFTAAQSAEALNFLAKAGFTSAEALGSLGSMIDLATASGEEFAQVADMSSDLLGAFGLNVSDTSQKIENLNRLNDVLVKSANSANVTIETMFETMKTAAPIGRSLGIELEEVAALTAVLGSAGIKGTEAGTALKNSFLNLAAQKKPVVDMLSSIGVSVDDGTGNMRKFTDILADIGERTKGLGELQTAKIFDELFGKRAIAGATNLADSISELRDFEKTLKNAGNTSKLTAEIMRQSLDARIKALGSAAADAGFKILTAFEHDGKRGIDALTTSIREADLSGLIESLKVILSIAKGIASAFSETGKFLGESAAKAVIFAEKIHRATGGDPSTSIGGAFSKAAQARSALDRGDVEEWRRLMGFSKAEEPQEKTAPNAGEAQARAEQLQFKGQLDILGAPAGSTLEQDSELAAFNVALLGAN